MATTITAGNATNGAAISSDNTGILELKTGTGSGTTGLTLDASQNVGIGTSSPSSKLNVYDATSSVITASGDAAANIISYRASTDAATSSFAMRKARGTIASPTAVASGDTVGTIFFQAYGGTNNRNIASITGVVDTYTSDSDISANLRFATSPSGSATSTERMRITSGGVLLVNTVTSASTGQVEIAKNGERCLTLHNTATGTGAQEILNFIRNGTQVGNINTTGSATAYVTSSDYRLKENVQPMVGALEKVAALKPVTYKWKLDGTDGQGFIAHELQDICPDAVTGEKDAIDTEGKPVYQGIDTSFLVATLTAAIQELKAELDATKAEIAALKGAA